MHGVLSDLIQVHFLFLLENSILEERVLLASMFRKIFWSLNCSTFALHNVYKLS